MPLVRHADLHATAKSEPAKKVFSLVGARTHDDVRPMPQPPKPRLPRAEQKVLDDWIAQGAPASTSSESCEDDAGDAGPDVTIPVDLPTGCPNVTLKAATPYAMPSTARDQYVCFGVDITLPKKRHVVNIAPKIDNATITHHAVVYLANESQDPNPHDCNAVAASRRRMIYAWAPGGEALELPAEAGLPLEGTTHLVVQMHYSNLNGLANQVDQSAIELCTTDVLRPNDADVMAFGTTNILAKPRATTTVDCALSVPATTPSLQLFRSMPHMHQLGRSIGSSRERGGESPVIIDEVANWSFGLQPWNAIDVKLQSGDTVRSYCSWTNGGDTPVTWGEKTSDEMCYHFVMYYPRITTAGWSWDAPLSIARCTERN